MYVDEMRTYMLVLFNRDINSGENEDHRDTVTLQVVIKLWHLYKKHLNQSKY